MTLFGGVTIMTDFINSAEMLSFNIFYHSGAAPWGDGATAP